MFSVEALASLSPTSDSATARTNTPKRNGLKPVHNLYWSQITYSAQWEDAVQKTTLWKREALFCSVWNSFFFPPSIKRPDMGGLFTQRVSAHPFVFNANWLSWNYRQRSIFYITTNYDPNTLGLTSLWSFKKAMQNLVIHPLLLNNIYFKAITTKQYHKAGFPHQLMHKALATEPLSPPL